MFATNSSEKDPVAAYKLFAQKRPDGMTGAESPFYLAVNHVKARSSSSKSWFKGRRKQLGGLMKEMVKKVGLEILN